MTPSGVRWGRITDASGVLLRPPADADVPGVFAVHRDPAVYRHDPQETHPDPDHTARFLAPMRAHWAEHGFGYWAVLVPSAVWPDGVAGADSDDADRVLAGLGGIQHHTLAGRPVLNVYYRFARAAQGRGLARIVLDRAIEIAPLVATGVDIVVRTRPASTVARHVAERAGFIDEGLEPGSTDMQMLRRRAWHR
ncbi:RimJ/RimL family protein N-acetyltransferase [Microbacterium marinum]|uniref:RimJ/RimL family protein N-acetyltransferase n=1 Tax=Microbacterium marinum TaxID=421115 RepID=A0A7W7BQF5_9MICO|nr:RimJ/RimL family protein N-acetyltransferase [Microbacterium marinum]